MMSNDTTISGDAPQESSPLYFSRPNGVSIAYHKVPAEGVESKPSIVFLTGFMSDMGGSKALALHEFAVENGYGFLRFDYQGHGESSGKFADGTIGLWTEDAIAVVDELTDGPQILVGSSMGGWIMLLTALARPVRVAGLVGLAAAPDFTEDLLAAELTDAQMAEVKEKGFVVVPSDYEDDYTFTQALFEDGRENLVLREQIPLDCPVRLLHGLEDTSVPWQTALKLQTSLRSSDVEVTLIKNGDHRLSEDADLDRLTGTIAALMNGF